MKHKKPHQSIRVFQNPYLEKLTHVHPITPLVMWGPVVAYLYYRSVFTLGLSVFAIALISVVAFIFWTLAEYLLHRFIFHYNPKGPVQERIMFLVHGLHHDDPVDPTRLVMPPVGSLVLAVILFSAFRGFFGLFGAAEIAQPFFAAFVIGYLCYDYTHYGIHHFNPRSRLGKMVKQHHMLHHYATSHAKWGVSSPLWDYLLGTVHERKNARNSKGDGYADPRVESASH